jgi:hypothetical protein
MNLNKCSMLTKILRGDDRVQRRISGLKRDKVTGGWRNYTMRSSIICNVYHV